MDSLVLRLGGGGRALGDTEAVHGVRLLPSQRLWSARSAIGGADLVGRDRGCPCSVLLTTIERASSAHLWK